MIPVNQGSRGPEVLFLQRMLNKHGANPRLSEDEVYGPVTKAAVLNFQSSHRLPQMNGMVTDPTWRALGLQVDIVHNIHLMGQPTNMTCWSAAATMILGNMSIGPGLANTAPNGGLRPNIENIDTFLNGLGWRLVNNSSAPPISVLMPHLMRTPLWLGFEGGTFKHAVVASAVYSDRTDDGTVLRIHDPWPPARGTIYGTTYVARHVTLRSVTPHRRAMIQYAAAPR